MDIPACTLTHFVFQREWSTTTNSGIFFRYSKATHHYTHRCTNFSKEYQDKQWVWWLWHCSIFVLPRQWNRYSCFCSSRTLHLAWGNQRTGRLLWVGGRIRADAWTVGLPSCMTLTFISYFDVNITSFHCFSHILRETDRYYAAADDEMQSTFSDQVRPIVHYRLLRPFSLFCPPAKMHFRQLITAAPLFLNFSFQ